MRSPGLNVHACLLTLLIILLFNSFLFSTYISLTLNFEAVTCMSRCNNIQDARKAAKENPCFKDAFQDCVEALKVLLSFVFQRLKLNGQPTNSFSQASPSEMEVLWSYILDVDKSVSQEDRAKKEISTKKDL